MQRGILVLIMVTDAMPMTVIKKKDGVGATANRDIEFYDIYSPLTRSKSSLATGQQAGRGAIVAAANAAATAGAAKQGGFEVE